MIDQFLKLIVMFTLMGGSVNAQVYNEEDIRQQLDKYIANPKSYYDKMKEVNTKADKANENTLKISEEYLSLLDKKDSLLKMYKSQLAKVKSATPATTTSTVTTKVISDPSTTATSVSVPKKQNIATLPNTPYRVQLAAFYRDDFSKFFGTFNKTIGVEKLDDRNVIEVQGFKDSLEAFEFSQKIKKLGFGGAFVTKYDNNGVRQEGYVVNKNGGSKFSYGKETAATNIEYPNYVPVGVKEIKASKIPLNPTTTAASKPATKIDYPNYTPAGVQEIKDKPSQLKNPSIIKKTIIASTPPSAGTPPAPKTLANATPPQPKQPAPKKESGDQLDAAFDQLFKR